MASKTAFASAAPVATIAGSPPPCGARSSFRRVLGSGRYYILTPDLAGRADPARLLASTLIFRPKPESRVEQSRKSLAKAKIGIVDLEEAWRFVL